MDPHLHHHGHDHGQHAPERASLNRTAWAATLHPAPQVGVRPGLSSLLSWGSLAGALAIAAVAAYPVNRWLIARGLGHAVVHA